MVRFRWVGGGGGFERRGMAALSALSAHTMQQGIWHWGAARGAVRTKEFTSPSQEYDYSL